MSISNPEYSHSKFLRPIEFDQESHHAKGGLMTLMVLAIGIVFGDIGTSPLYALKSCFDPVSGIPLNRESVFGVLSMVFWTFVIVVSLKYVAYVMRANNHGEGGILALMALALRTAKQGSVQATTIMVMGVLGACLFYGDAVLTPAISVLSAIEGLTVVSDDFAHIVVPLTLLILVGLFLFEKKGTEVVGILFGPLMLLWFATIGAMGVYQIAQSPDILMAFSPWYALQFMAHNAAIAFAVTGAVFLVVTGAEALYADMGHFGIRPIRYAWFLLVMPALLLNYFGQGALLIRDPQAISNPFFLMVPSQLIWPLVILSACATVIASQACISGAYSMTSEAILLGFVPRMKVVHTSDREIGQIYVPFINWVLCVLVVMVVLAFRKSENLATAYGIAVSSTMLITSALTAVVMHKTWNWKPLKIALLVGTFLVVDAGFFAANSVKIMEGGWFPLAIAGALFVLMMTWYQGRQLLRAKAIKNGIGLEDFIPSLLAHPPHRIDGTSVFLTAHIDFVPPALLHNLKHNRVLHKQVIFLKMSTWDIPYVHAHRRISVKEMCPGIYLVRAVYGFKETPDVGLLMEALRLEHGIDCPPMETSYFMARDSLVVKEIPQMPLWRESLFVWMMQNAARASDFFRVDSERLIEIGAKIEL